MRLPSHAPANLRNIDGSLPTIAFALSNVVAASGSAAAAARQLAQFANAWLADSPNRAAKSAVFGSLPPFLLNGTRLELYWASAPG
jgi:hypothetical protein